VKGEDEERVREVCRAHGLDVTGVERVGAVLVLRWDRSGGLPTARGLRELARALQSPELRYVTLSLE
jgi:hypothetical protein